MLKKLSGMFDLPHEVTRNLPLITITGSERVSIENFKGVIEYTEERVRINTPCGVLRIAGRGLALKQVTSENILVTGGVTGLEYLL
ncbi:MAG: YabP/YqfC family sporulation protein [Defluviitaleaceae bacterium]|nr:YabP/YqfC family sporulation protein [Defluviitaleaceae bacterium]